MQPAQPAGRAPARRRAGAIAAFTGVVLLLHAALLSEVRWTWPAPPAPFGALEVRALAAPSAPGLAIGAEPGRGVEAGARIEGSAVMAADEMRRFGVIPKVALLSHSNFGSANSESAKKMRAALALVVWTERGRLFARRVPVHAAA